MLWNEFIEKVKTFKKEAGKTGLNAPSIIRLVYGGAFDEMLTPEMKIQPAHLRYADMCAEVLKAMGSKASLPKAGAKEFVGIKNINGIGHLMLWRFSTNPFVSYDVTDFCKGFLRSEGFERPQIPEGDITWVKPARGNQKLRIDVRYSWNDLFNKPRSLESYQKDRLLAVVGIIVKAERKIYQGSKESMAITLFNGHEYIEGVRMWPGEGGKLNPLVTGQLKEFSLGMALIKPKAWNDRPSGSFIAWTGVLGAN